MSGEIECAECIRLLAALAGRSEGGPGVRIADIITLDGDRVWLNDDFLDAVMEARAHLAVHANRTEPCIHSYRLDCACGETGCTKLACLYCMQHKPCEACGGSGEIAYGDTSLGRGGYAGQTVTAGPCPGCQGVK